MGAAPTTNRSAEGGAWSSPHYGRLLKKSERRIAAPRYNISIRQTAEVLMLREGYVIPMTELDPPVFAVLVPLDHEWRPIARWIDFSFIPTLVASAYDPTLGRPAEDKE